MALESLDQRETRLDGSVNFRDLGGLRTNDGQMVRRGMVFRSDALHGLTETDLELLAEFRIATLIDLRSEAEIARSGPSPLVSSGTRVLHHPVISAVTVPDDAAMSEPMEFMYAKFLSGGQATFGAIFKAMSEDEHLPTVIHCAAGKDRTGVTVALLLRLLGVSDEAISLDYALTDRNMSRLIERLSRETVDGQSLSYPPHVMRALSTTMDAFLVSLDETFGSAEAFLIQAGVTEHELATIRERLLQSAD